MGKRKQKRRSLPVDEAKIGEVASADSSVNQVEGADRSPWRRRWTVIGGIVAFFGAVAGITGYTLKDALNSLEPLEFAIGDVAVQEREECAVVFSIQPTGDEYPRLLGLPITISNPSETTAKNIDVLIKCTTPLRVWPQELSKSHSLGAYGDMKRITGEADEVSTASWTTERIAPGKAFIVVEALLWEKDVWKVDTPVTIDISIDADDRPTRTQAITLWIAMAFGPTPDSGIAVSKEAQRADRGLLVYFENYKLITPTKGFDSPFYSFHSMDDIKYKELETVKKIHSNAGAE